MFGVSKICFWYKLIFLFSYGELSWSEVTVITFIMFQKWIRYSFELSVHQSILEKHVSRFTQKY